MNIVKLGLLLLLANCSHAMRILSTMYSGSVGAGGGRLNAYPARVRIGTRTVKVYPVALYSDRITAHKFKLIKLKNPKNGKIAYGHVADECSSGDCHDNRYKAHKRHAMLVDVHKTMWKALGLKTYGIHDIKGAFVGSKRYTHKNSSGIRKVTTDDGKKNYLPPKWKV